MGGIAGSINKYEVVFSGEVIEGFTIEDARENVVGTFIFDPISASKINFDGNSSVLYRSSSKHRALDISKSLHKAGLRCKVRRRGEEQPKPGASGNARTVALAIVTTALLFSIFILQFMFRL